MSDTKIINFSTLKHQLEYPDFLEVQLKSFADFFQMNSTLEQRKKEGLYKVFQENFPITDTRNNFVLEFLDYSIDPPRYTIEECLERGLTYSVALKVKLKLYCTDPEHEDFETIVQEVYLGQIPYMTPRGTFIINGAERVIVSQLHRSPGVFFGQSIHPNGTKLYSARIIPFKGAWIEFATDVNNVMYAYIDRKKKLPVTTLLRAIGYETDSDILKIFDIADEVEVTPENLKDLVGRKLAARVLKVWTEDFVDEDTGEVVTIERNEVLIERETVIEEQHLPLIEEAQVKTVLLHKQGQNENYYSIIYNTLNKDTTNSQQEALTHIYRLLRNSEPPDEATARDVFEKLFFSDKRYDLGEVGRYKMNKKLGLDIDLDVRVLTNEDIIAIIKHMIELINTNKEVDDIDHLSNRRVRTVGEQLYNQFSVGLARLARTVRERMNVRDNEVFAPVDLINARILSSVINSFFGTNQLSQFMDQTNPLAEMTHKRRTSALGPGGLTRERAGFEVRDVHYSHYGRLCPIETPEGPNIGLISSLCVYAKINSLGFIETPYYEVKDGKVDYTKWKYYSAEEEENKVIAQANAEVDDEGKLVSNRIKSRLNGDFPVVTPDKVDLIDVAPNQIASISASLIPFLEHNDANRALMGSNMMRQAVPLLKTEAPIVGTGLEPQVVRDSRYQVIAEADGVVEYVDAMKIVVRYERSEEERLLSFEDDVKVYNLPKFKKTNQNTCLNLKPIVRKGQKVKKGDILTEGFATSKGELALGKNLLVAFMPWKGYNFEDAIVISERVVREDIFTSIHIDEHQLEVRETKRGLEELTPDIPNVSEEATKNLDENGIIRIGAKVRPGDILIGKITPKGESDLTPEEKLLIAIFGEKAGNVKDASLRVSPADEGIVIDKKLFSRAKRRIKASDPQRVKIDQEFEQEKERLRNILIEKLLTIVKGKTSQGVKDYYGNEVIAKGIKFSAKTFENINFLEVDPKKWTTDKKKNELIEKLLHNYYIKYKEIEAAYQRKIHNLTVGDELPVGIVQLAKVYLAKKRKLKVGDKMAGRHGNKGVVAKIVRIEDMPYLEDGTPVDIVLNPLGVPSRMNLGQIFETILGWAGKELGLRFYTPIFDGPSLEEITKYTDKAGLPRYGKTYLYDGQTGDRFDQPATVGVIYMMKLIHLVDDKVHARAIGSYSLITQQPLGGKAQFGGQRFGEMEVWALEAFGAAHILQEILTVKSDDVEGRSKTYEAIVKGKPFPKPGIPESFNVLLHELRGLALNVRLEKDEN